MMPNAIKIKCEMGPWSRSRRRKNLQPSGEVISRRSGTGNSSPIDDVLDCDGLQTPAIAWIKAGLETDFGAA